MSAGFLERTFQLISGVGGWRERDLWARGFDTWVELEAAAAQGVVLAKRLDGPLLEAIDAARTALRVGDLASLAKMVPPREHWRLYPHFQDHAAFFDIEADGDQVPTVVSVMDRDGVATFRRGVSLQQLPERLARSSIWVTFNGSAFDVPALERVFPDFPRPLVHLDLRFLVRKTQLSGGLKAIETTLGLHRPPHLKGVRGFDAIRLWRLWNEGDLAALRILVEYNLYDAVNLRSVLDWCTWRMTEILGWQRVERRPIFQRGDVLYDVSKLVLSQGASSVR